MTDRQKDKTAHRNNGVIGYGAVSLIQLVCWSAGLILYLCLDTWSLLTNTIILTLLFFSFKAVSIIQFFRKYQCVFVLSARIIFLCSGLILDVRNLFMTDRQKDKTAHRNNGAINRDY